LDMRLAQAPLQHYFDFVVRIFFDLQDDALGRFRPAFEDQAVSV
jgi:hypothetical protein